MRSIYPFLFTALIFQLSCNGNKSTQHVTTDGEIHESTIPSKQNYLNYLDSIKSRRCIAGQFIRWNYNASLQEISAVHDSSGQWLGMLGADYYGNFQDSLPSPRCAYELTNEVIKSYYSGHGLVNLSVHFVNPQSLGSAWDKEIDFDSLFLEDSRVKDFFIEELDSVATGLKDLCDAGIMVMFRPFHEMNGDWFWWGRRERYVELWKYTYNYMVNIKGLDNLLWCWSPDAGGGPFDQYFPGNDFVDVVGLDAYTPNLPEIGTAYTEILKYNKPFGFTEYGCKAGTLTENPNFDFSLFLTWISTTFPETTFFLAWRDYWGMANKRGVKKLLNDPMIINRGELSSF